MWNPGVKARISKKLLSQLPKLVADQLADVAGKRIHTLTYHQEKPGFQLYLDEGAYYVVIYKDQVGSVRMISENTIGAAVQGNNYRVGERVPLPVGTVVIERQIFLGKYLLDIYNVTEGDDAVAGVFAPPALPA
jgi:hypothetical protein